MRNRALAELMCCTALATTAPGRSAVAGEMERASADRGPRPGPVRVQKPPENVNPASILELSAAVLTAEVGPARVRGRLTFDFTLRRTVDVTRRHRFVLAFPQTRQDPPIVHRKAYLRWPPSALTQRELFSFRVGDPAQYEGLTAGMYTGFTLTLPVLRSGSGMGKRFAVEVDFEKRLTGDNHGYGHVTFPLTNLKPFATPRTRVTATLQLSGLKIRRVRPKRYRRLADRLSVEFIGPGSIADLSVAYKGDPTKLKRRKGRRKPKPVTFGWIVWLASAVVAAVAVAGFLWLRDRRGKEAT